MALGVIRLEPSREPLAGALIAHVVGDIRPATAHVRKHLGLGVEMFKPSAEDLAAAVREVRELAAEKRGGKAPHLGLSMLMAGGPATDDVHFDASTIPDDAPATLPEGRPWTLADCRRFVRRQRELVLEALPGATVVSALHLDEAKVHGHHETTAVAGGRVGNLAVREAFARIAPGFAEANAAARKRLAAVERAAAERDAAAKAAGQKVKRRRRWKDQGPDHCYVDHREQLRLVHDLYAQRFSDFGIRRGERGKRQYHERVDRAKGMEAKAEAIRRETEAAERAARNARAREQVWVSAGAAGREAALDSAQTLVELQDKRRAVRTDVEEETRTLADLREERSTEQAGLESDQRRRAEARGLFVQLREQFESARQIFARFWAAAEETTRRLRADVDDLVSRRTQLAQAIERDEEKAEKAAETVNSLEAKARTSRAAADRAVEADRLRIKHSRAAANKTIAAHQAETSKAETARAAAEAAARSAGAARDRDQLAAREAATLLEEKQNALTDDRAAGGWAWGFVSTGRGREVKRELDEERRLRTEAEAARDAAIHKVGEVQAKVTARETELAALRGKLTDEVDAREYLQDQMSRRERRAHGQGWGEGWGEASQRLGTAVGRFFEVARLSRHRDVAELLAATAEGDPERVTAAADAFEAGLPAPVADTVASPVRAPERPGRGIGT